MTDVFLTNMGFQLNLSLMGDLDKLADDELSYLELVSEVGDFFDGFGLDVTGSLELIDSVDDFHALPAELKSQVLSGITGWYSAESGVARFFSPQVLSELFNLDMSFANALCKRCIVHELAHSTSNGKVFPEFFEEGFAELFTGLYLSGVTEFSFPVFEKGNHRHLLGDLPEKYSLPNGAANISGYAAHGLEILFGRYPELYTEFLVARKSGDLGVFSKQLNSLSGRFRELPTISRLDIAGNGFKYGKNKIVQHFLHDDSVLSDVAKFTKSTELLID